MRYGDGGLVVVAIAFEAEEQEVQRRARLREFVADQDINYLVLDGGLPEEFATALPSVKNVRGFPVELLIDRNGGVAAARNGYGFEKKWARKLGREIETLLGASAEVAGPAMAQETPPELPSCRENPAYREFDFWVGEWTVRNAKGKEVGSNVITEKIRGCMLFESWTGAGGSVGQSINYYDPVANAWKQVWVDGSGGNITLEGNFEAPAMTLTGNHVYPDGRHEAIRGTWTLLEDGRVRQHFEQSKDGGKSWYTWFDGYYERRDSK